MKTVWRLALAAGAAALLTAVLGSWTRINGAGLTCPDWPLCNGHVLPALAGGTLWEWLHRLLASSVAPLVAALVFVAWGKRERSPFVIPTLACIVALFFIQVFLGAATVRLGNSPVSVVLHWGTAMAFIASLAAMAVFAAASQAQDRIPEPRSAYSVGILGIAAAAAFMTMCVGAYVSSSGAGLACLTIPGCAGNVVVFTSGQYVQMVHRILAAATLMCGAGALAAVWARPASRRVRAATAAGAGLLCLQVLLGLLNVALRLPTELREAHAVNAALAFLAFFVAAVFAGLDAWPLGASARLSESVSKT